MYIINIIILQLYQEKEEKRGKTAAAWKKTETLKLSYENEQCISY